LDKDKIYKLIPFSLSPTKSLEEINEILNTLKIIQEEIDEEKLVENKEMKTKGYNYKHEFIIHKHGDDIIDYIFSKHKNTSKFLDRSINMLKIKHNAIKVEYCGHMKI